MRNFGIFNYFTVFIMVLSLFFVSFFSPIYSTLKSAPNVLAFLHNARVYDNVSKLVRLEIETFYPQQIRSNILLYGLANTLVDIVVTPETVALAATPSVNLSFQFAKTPTSIFSDKIVLETAGYKRQISEMVGELSLPRLVTSNVDLIVDSLPQQITLVDLQKRPHSVLAVILRFRSLFFQSEIILRIAWILFWVFTVLTVVANLHAIRRVFSVLWSVFLISGISLFLLTYFFPIFLNVLLPQTGEAITIATNALVLDVVIYFLTLVRTISLYYLGVGIVFFCIWKLVHFNSLQSILDKHLHRLHIPHVTVKVK